MADQTKLNGAEDKGADQSADLEARFADKAQRDGRSLSSLALIGLVVGIGFMAFTVFVTMVDSLRYSPFFQDPTIQRLMFCVGIGIVLASLGDYAFYGIAKSVAIGGAGAIALILYYVIASQPNEETLKGQIQIKEANTALSGVYVIVGERELTGQLDKGKKTATIYNFSFPVSLGERLGRECFAVQLTTAKQPKKFEINGNDAKMPHTVRSVFNLVFDEKADTLTHRAPDGKYHVLPPCLSEKPDDKPAEVLPSKVDVKTQQASKASSGSEGQKKGWSYYGALNKDGSWRERLYDNRTQRVDLPPRKGDEVEATDDIYVRKGPKKCDESGNCEKLTEPVGYVETGEKVSVQNVVTSKNPKRFDTVWIEVLR